MRRRPSIISRRTLLAGAAATLAAPMITRSSCALAGTGSMTFTGYGGVYHEMMMKYAVGPFSEETGIKVNIVPAPDLAKIKAQILTGRVELDVIDASGSLIASGSRQGFWEPLDPLLFDISDLTMRPSADNVPWYYYTAGIGWDPQKYGEGKHPKIFSDYFDAENFPGKRVFRNRANETLEAALLADGVAPKDIYPLDVDRAFKRLDKIKRNVASWAPTSTQQLLLCQNGETDFTLTYANRVRATNAPGGGTPLAFSFEQNTLALERLAVVKGAPNKENAMKFIAFVMRPEIQARAFDAFPFVPTSKKATASMSQEAVKWLPKKDNPNNLVIDDAYWAEHEEVLSPRFREWIMT